MTISGNINITCNGEENIQSITIYDNNNQLSIEYASTLASLEAIHNTKADAHSALFNALISKNDAQDILISGLSATKADKTEIQTPGNGTITIKQGNTEKGSFSLNQSGNTTINLDAATNQTIDNTLDNSSENPLQNKVIANELGNKANKDLSNCTKPYITETYSNGTSWYRVYSDGWCEQGGQGTATSAASDYTVNLLKTMADTNYGIYLTLNKSSSPSGDYYSAYTSKTQTTFVIQTRPTGFCWEVKGFITSANS